jgi:DNA-binding CsgD family transcriptional regulator
LLSGDRPAGPDLQALTDREREGLQLIVRGLTTKEIATKFDISARTVETHRTNLMRKLGVKSVALLTQVAIREGLLDVESQAD